MFDHLLETLSPWGAVGYGAAQVLALLTMPSVLLRRRGEPRGTLSWLLALFALPVMGVIAWWLFGRTTLRKRRQHRVKKFKEFMSRQQALWEEVPEAFRGVLPARALGEAMFPSHGNKVEVLCDGEEIFGAMEEAIASASQCVLALFYIWKEDGTGRKVLEMLKAKAADGASVRVLVDSWGSPDFMKKHGKELAQAGVHAAAFLPAHFRPFDHPVINFVNHRKILVVDHAVAFTGGVNIADEYVHPWHDVMVRIEGPGASALEHIFLEDWYFATDELPKSGAQAPPQGEVELVTVAGSPDGKEALHDAFFWAVNQASERLWILTPYFIPSAALLMVLRAAANRGVDVRIMMPANSDVWLVKLASRPYYLNLLDAHIKVYEYQGPVLHAKVMVIDQLLVSVGTANLDTRSLRLSFELCCFFEDEAANAKLTAYYESLLCNAKAITKEDILNQSYFTRLLQGIAHLGSPLL